MDGLVFLLLFIWATLINWSIFQALLIFPVLVMGVRLWGKLRAGGSLSRRDFVPSEALTWSLSNNIALNLFNGFIWSAALTGYYAYKNGFWETHLGLELVPVLTSAPFWAQVVLILVLIDFAYYWIHRMLHHPILWDIHALHHSDKCMNFSTTYRVHVLELIFMGVVALFLIGWLDLPVEAAAIAWIIRDWHQYYIHCQLPFDHGRFRKVLASPNYHRWHHADDEAVYGKNLCDMFPAWDLLFGTHHDPGTCTVKTGVSDVPDDVVRGQLHPLVMYAKRLSVWVRQPFQTRA